MSQSNTRLYFDHASGTPIDKDVLQKMQKYFSDNFYNPGALYREGVEMRTVIEEQRISISKELKSRPTEIYFTDGATEANNLALIGVVRQWQNEHPGKPPHIITTLIEHASVLSVCKKLEAENISVTYLNVNQQGNISLKELKESIQKNTIVISIGYVNGEIGTIQDIKSIMKAVRHFRKHNNSTYPYFHTDAVQAVNHIDEIGVPQLGVDMMTINASKIYGPKKIGALFVKTGVKIESIIFGGNQEKGMRSGTENVPYIVGMSESLVLSRELQISESERLVALKKYFILQLEDTFSNIYINAKEAFAVPNIVNISFPNISHEEVVIRLDSCGIMASVKSACKAGEDGDSHVIRAITQDNRPTGSIRFSMGRSTTKKCIDRVVNELDQIVSTMNETFEKYYKE